MRGDPAPAPEADERGFEQAREGRLSDPTEAERGERDAELVRREVGIELSRDAERRACPKPALARQLLEPRRADLDDRELGSDEGSVRSHEGEGDEQHERSSHRWAGRITGRTRSVSKASATREI